jgi:pimeloyl-ACP methyl ester carboxylesterase
VQGKLRIWKFTYRAHSGAVRHAYVALPRAYRAGRDGSIPLVISPHGRGVTGRGNLRLWGQLPARGSFAVVSPDGHGRVLANYSWGSPGQVEDLARMPQIVHKALPWLRIDRKRVYAFGGSMGGQETLLLLARHPRLLAGVATFDAVADFALQYRQFTRLQCDRGCRKTWRGPIGKSLQQLARRELGGGPKRARVAYARRSPLTYAHAIAFSCVPLQIWWSPRDEIVIGQRRQSGRFFETLRRLNPAAPVGGFTGGWRHSAEMRATTRLPLALAIFGLMPASYQVARGMIVMPPDPPADGVCR